MALGTTVPAAMPAMDYYGDDAFRLPRLQLLAAMVNYRLGMTSAVAEFYDHKGDLTVRPCCLRGDSQAAEIEEVVREAWEFLGEYNVAFVYPRLD